MRRVRAVKGHTAAVFSLALDRQQRYLATGGADAVACLWDMQVGVRAGGSAGRGLQQMLRQHSRYCVRI
jgi:WD40 repeat protein